MALDFFRASGPMSRLWRDGPRDKMGKKIKAILRLHSNFSPFDFTGSSPE